ncbi:MAG: hypothetical protein ACI9FB_002222 [Candidatus Azotimanducaceae bacterium]|jgi:hypothetical protein
MKFLSKKLRYLGILGLLTMTISGSAFAEYYISAFDNGKAFNSLIRGDVEGAMKKFSQTGDRKLSYADINNLCVGQVLSKETAGAVGTCLSALDKVGPSILYKERSSMKSAIYSNLAVARALNGDKVGAIEAVRFSIRLNGRNENALKNHELLMSNQLAAD